ncbi:helix-turn-helix domain-containing protein [Komagataeibacter europaeus]|uniref:helix-turn-helix domain-containing protein n=1 Tax=Komagataeibacter europaeus TaxID=33995 RepID=UPI0009D9B1BE
MVLMTDTARSHSRPITEQDRARGRRIAQARTKKELTQVQLADMVGLSGGLVGQWETGKVTLTAKNAAKLEKILEVPMAWLLTGDDPHEKRLAQTQTEQEYLDVIRDIPVDQQEAFLSMVRAAASMISKQK